MEKWWKNGGKIGVLVQFWYIQVLGEFGWKNGCNLPSPPFGKFAKSIGKLQFFCGKLGSWGAILAQTVWKIDLALSPWHDEVILSISQTDEVILSIKFQPGWQAGAVTSNTAIEPWWQAAKDRLSTVFGHAIQNLNEWPILFKPIQRHEIWDTRTVVEKNVKT